MKKILIYFFLSCFLLSQTSNNIIVLSRKVGITIDAAENSILDLFPDIVGFESAQIYKLSENRYMAKIVYIRNTKYRLKKRYFNWVQLERLKYKINSKPQITEKQKEIEYDYMSYLKAYNILDEIPKNTFCTIKIKNGNKINGTYVGYEKEYLNIQSFRSQFSFDIQNIDYVDFRLFSENNIVIKKQISFFTSTAFGLLVSEVWNNQRSPKDDMVWYNRFAGIIFSLFLSNEIYEAILHLTSPKERIVFSPEELVKTK